MVQPYIKDKFFMRLFEREWWIQLFKNLNIPYHDDQAFVLHVYRSMLKQPNRLEDGGGIPISYTLRIKELPKSDLNRISQIVEYKRHSRFLGLSRTYSIREPFFSEVLSLSERMRTEEILTSPRVDFFSGKPPRRKFKGQGIYRDRSNNEEPEVIQEVLRTLAVGQPIPCNIRAIYEHITLLLYEKNRCEIDFGRQSEKYKSAEKRYLNDFLCYLSLLDHVAYQDGDILYFYVVYEVSSTGRLYVLGRGLQSASRAMKAAAYRDIPCVNIQNWDLDSAHPNFLRQYIEDELHYHPQSLNHYLEDGVRAKMAAAVGIRADIFKRIILSLVNGARMPITIIKNPHIQNTVIELLEEEFGDEQQKIKLALEGLRDLTQGLQQDLKPFHIYVMNEWPMKYGMPQGRAGRTIILPKIKTKNRSI